MNTVIAVARFEAAEETGMFRATLVQCLVFCRTPLALLLRGAGSFAAEGLNKKAISSPLRPPVACRERIYPFRFVASTDAVNTTARSRGFALAFPLRGRCRLRRMRCYFNLCRQAKTLFNRISISVQTPSKLRITSKFEYRQTVSPRPRKYSSRSASYAIPASSQCCEPSSSITSFASAQ